MKTFDWKDKYFNTAGVDVTATAKYISLAGSKKGTYTRSNPTYTNYISDNQPYVLSGGNFDMTITSNGTTIIGQGMHYTDVRINWTYGSVYPSFFIRDLSCTSPGFSNYNVTFVCCMINKLNKGYENISIYSSIIRDSACNSNVLRGRSGSLTLVNCTDINQFGNLSLYNNCVVEINQTTINNCYTYYGGFNNCRFFIGSETQATPLIGNTAEELKQNFIDRCKAQNLQLRDINEYGQVSSMPRWCFSKSSIIGEYDLLENSEIDLFAKRRAINLGYIGKSLKQIPITTSQNIPASFAAVNPSKSVTISEGAITLNSPLDKKGTGYIDSKIIYLGGKHQLTTLSINESLLTQNGVALTPYPPFADATTLIEPDINYMVRSKDTQGASVRYNGVEYTSSLIERNNVFRGISGKSSLDSISGQAEVLPVVNLANYNKIQLRLVAEIPSQKITGTSGLQNGYWYMVIPENMAEPSGSVTYKGVQRPCFDSFLADNNTNFTINGACYLRRCWRQDYTPSDETTDKAFWQTRQKPIYFDVLPNDLRALRKNNTVTEAEMMIGDNEQYITSGHVDFYNMINGKNGTSLPAFNLVGTFLQIRLPISTQNPM